MAFLDVLYTADDDGTFIMRVKQETATAIGATQATTGADNDVQAKVTKSNREFGIRPRRIRIKRTIGTGDAAFNKYATLPIPTLSAFNAYGKGDAVSYDGQSWTVASKDGEDF